MAEHKENEWVSVADMMSSFVAVLIMVILTIDQGSGGGQAGIKVRKALNDKLNGIVSESDSTILYKWGVSGDTLVLSEGVFESGSPKLLKKMQEILSASSKTIHEILKSPFYLARVEGHSDTVSYKNGPQLKVERPNKDSLIVLKYRYDNVLLSLQRAMEARRVIVSGWNISDAENVSLLGYGPNKPIDKNALAPNRRVEITFEYLPNQKK